ncbi:hypothetical protein, partial [Escherichia coli]|uniref:hypothetical protein n=1 Tax=Escherichia coli TaxID=562 RepID=UPI000D0A64DD
HQAWCADCRMRRERLIRPTVPTPPVDLIRRASIASGMVCRLPDAAKTPYPAYRSDTACRPDKMRSIASGMVCRLPDAA